MKLFGIIAASTPIEALETKSDSASPSSEDNARLAVTGAANFAILESHQRVRRRRASCGSGA